MNGRHLYRNGAKTSQLRKFERRYGREKGRKVYGGVVGKVKREREAKKDPPPKAMPSGFGTMPYESLRLSKRFEKDVGKSLEW